MYCFTTATLLQQVLLLDSLTAPRINGDRKAAVVARIRQREDFMIGGPLFVDGGRGHAVDLASIDLRGPVEGGNLQVVLRRHQVPVDTAAIGLCGQGIV